MVYSFVEGWMHVDGIPALEEAVAVLAGKKGFAYQVVKDHRLLTPAFLSGFDVLVWNNNFDANRSVPDSTAKGAVLDYIHAGGGWVGIHGAMDYASQWPAFADLIGVSGNRWSHAESADLTIDREARSDPELVHMVAEFPPTVRLQGEKKGYDRTLRGTEGIVIGATLQNPLPRGLIPNDDGFTEQALWWARRHGKGRMFMTDLGHFRSQYALADSFLVRALWEHLRFAAGDYQNGCTDPASTHFDPDARVEDGSCADGVGLRGAGRSGASGNALPLILEGLHPSRFQLPFAAGSPVTVELHDLQGARVWARRLTDSRGNLKIVGPKPGVYQLRIGDGVRQRTSRVLLVGQD